MDTVRAAVKRWGSWNSEAEILRVALRVGLDHLLNKDESPLGKPPVPTPTPDEKQGKAISKAARARRKR